MANDYFKFKQFVINQAGCAMKVTTDACLQGAYFVQYLHNKINADSNFHFLDIGTGTGLLSLMLAQSFNGASVDAVEIEEQAYIQAKQNFNISKFSSRLNVFHSPIQDFKSDRKYDAIICNPPFFNNSLKNEDTAKKLARHDDALLQQDLVRNVKLLLNENGHFCVMYPYNEWQCFEDIANGNELCLNALLHVSPNEAKMENRTIGIFSHNKVETVNELSICIYKEQNVYSSHFTAWLLPFYLNM